MTQAERYIIQHAEKLIDVFGLADHTEYQTIHEDGTWTLVIYKEDDFSKTFLHQDLTLHHGLFGISGHTVERYFLNGQAI